MKMYPKEWVKLKKLIISSKISLYLYFLKFKVHRTNKLKNYGKFLEGNLFVGFHVSWTFVASFRTVNNMRQFNVLASSWF